MAIKLEGNWAVGLAFDVHTLSSTYLGADEQGRDHWDTTRTEMGELLYQLKYQQTPQVIPKIIALLDKIKGINTLDAIIPAPSSNRIRQLQPVEQVALALGEKVGVPVFCDILAKEPGSIELKNITDASTRAEVLRKQIKIHNAQRLEGLNVLLMDDLYRSGATLQVSTELLYKAGCRKVNVLTLTKTRSKR